jgi:hypothetical protein
MAVNPRYGPMGQCPLCDATLRSVHNPHRDDVTVYHGEDRLFSLDLAAAVALDHASLTGVIADGLITHLAALHAEIETAHQRAG